MALPVCCFALYYGTIRKFHRYSLLYSYAFSLSIIRCENCPALCFGAQELQKEAIRMARGTAKTLTLYKNFIFV